jgi:uncharacterized protein (TIGR02453 family)
MDAVRFFEGLEADNSKSYWTSNKELYRTQVLAPMTALLEDLAAEFGEGRVFRPYRDVRFSADKSPYKTNIAAHNDAGYISLSCDSLGVGTGLYMPSAEQLAAYRAAVARNSSGPELVALIAQLHVDGILVTAHEVLKSAPRGYAKDHPRIGLLRLKGITAWQEWPVGNWLATAEPKRRILAFLRVTNPLRDWIATNIG